MCNNFQSQRDKVIEAALAYVPFDGWSWKAMEAGAKDVANDAVLARRIFLNGLGEAADHFADWADRRMVAELNKMNLKEMRIRDRIHACVKTRIQLNASYKDALHRLVSFLALPHNTPIATRMTWRTCSVMWYVAGDRSTDWNHYSKRGLLVSVYFSTVLYWLSDEGDDSGDYPNTWAFLERRIDEVLKTFGLPRRLMERFRVFSKPFARRFCKAF